MSENTPKETVESRLKAQNDNLYKKLEKIFTEKGIDFGFDFGDDIKTIEEAFTGVVADELFGFLTEDDAPDSADLREQHLIGKILLNNQPRIIVVKYFVDVNDLNLKKYFGLLKLDPPDTVYA